MKHLKHLFTVLLLLCSVAVNAHNFEVDGIYYNITDATNKTVAVTYRGSSYAAYSNEYTGDVTIPETVTYNSVTYIVTSIGDEAFYDCSGLTSIEIPNSVTSIGSSAFSGCSGLTSVTIPNSVTSIGYYAFEGCSGLTAVHISDLSAWCNIDFGDASSNPLCYAKNLYLNGELVTELVIPDGIAKIKNYAFYNCSGLTSIEIPTSVTSIEIDAFYGTAWYNNQPDGVVYAGKVLYEYKGTMPENTSIIIEEGTLGIAGYAFYNCSGLTSVEIPNSVTSIGGSAFSGCSGLTSIEIGNSVTSIGNYAFSSCSNLTSIVIPNSVTSIGNYAFRGCSGLTSIVIPNSVTSIGDLAFEGCSGLTSVTIGNSVTRIGFWAFQGCKNLKTVINLSSLTITNGSTNNGYVGYYANKVVNVPNGFIDGDFVFRIIDGTNTLAGYLGCDANVVLPNDCKGEIYVVGAEAFRNNASITDVTIPEGVAGIKTHAFSGCTSLASIEIPNSVTSIGDYAFNGCTSLKDLHIEDGEDTLSLGYNGSIKGLFYDCPLETLYLGRNLSYSTSYSYGYSPFYNKTTLTSVTIGNSVTSIGNYAFSACTGLTSIEISNSVTSIGDYAFSACTALTSIEIPNSVTSIGDYAFGDCRGLKSIEIPNSVTSIGSSAFEYCSGLTSIAIPNSVTSIGDYAFYNCRGLKSIEIPNSVTSIGDYAFCYCSGLKTVVNFSNLTFEKGSSDNGYIAYYADKVINAPGGEMTGDFCFFTADGKNYLACYIGDDTEITLPASYKGESYEIAANAFKQNSSITNVNFTNGVTCIGENAFSGCTALEKIELPNSVTSIGNFAFYSCYGLRKVVVPENVTYIGESAFENCAALAEIRSFIPAVRLFVPGDYAFEGVDKDACILYVPQDAKEVYATTAGWSDFANIIDGGNIFTVTYIVDGEVYATDSIAYGDEVVLIDEPVREGHTFSGWSEVPATMPAKNITITGSFTVNSYTVTYMLDGEVYETFTIEYGEEIPIVEVQNRVGYTFSGWSEIPERMPANNITIEGKFTVKSYTITYVVDGEVYATDSVAYGDEVVLIDEPVREGHTFSGWSEVPATMPAEDITVTGAFTKTDTGIDEVTGEGKNVVYDLNGRHITDTEHLERGVYIINGKKIVVK